MSIKDYIKSAGLKFAGQLKPRPVTNGIVIHHVAALTATPQQIHEWHLKRGWLGAGYHVYVRKDGSVWELRPLWAVGAHAEGVNDESIGVCAEGMYHPSDSQPYDREMPQQQFEALVKVVKDLMAEYPSIKWIKGHNQVEGAATACPGSLFPLQEIVRAATISPNVKEVDVMKKGDQGPMVERLQRLLIALGYQLPKHGVDGIFGYETEAAVNAFKKSVGLPQNGIVDVPTVLAMAERLLASKDALEKENATLRSRVQLMENGLKKITESYNVSMGAIEKCKVEFEEKNKKFIEFFKLLNQLIKEVEE